MEKIRFADFVASEVDAGRFQRHWSWFSNRMEICSLGYYSEKEHSSDAFVFGAKGIFFGSYLKRSNIGFLKLTKSESKMLRNLWNEELAKLKAKNKAKKLAHKKALQEAEWWP